MISYNESRRCTNLNKILANPIISFYFNNRHSPICFGKLAKHFFDLNKIIDVKLLRIKKDIFTAPVLVNVIQIHK